MLQKNIDWKFNPPAASNFGGVWERLIRSVRKVLYSILHEQSIRHDDESVNTLFCEVEAILNGRPITSVSNDVNDLKVLTPNDLLLLRNENRLPPGILVKKTITSEGDGGNIWPICSGIDGQGNIYLCYKREKSGTKMKGT